MRPPRTRRRRGHGGRHVGRGGHRRERGRLSRTRRPCSSALDPRACPPATIGVIAPLVPRGRRRPLLAAVLPPVLGRRRRKTLALAPPRGSPRPPRGVLGDDDAGEAVASARWRSWPRWRRGAEPRCGGPGGAATHDATSDSSVTVVWAGGNDAAVQKYQADHAASRTGAARRRVGALGLLQNLEAHRLEDAGARDEVVTVTAQGMNPTRALAGDNGYNAKSNYLQLMQCWGDRRRPTSRRTASGVPGVATTAT